MSLEQPFQPQDSSPDKTEESPGEDLERVADDSFLSKFNRWENIYPNLSSQIGTVKMKAQAFIDAASESFEDEEAEQGRPHTDDDTKIEQEDLHTKFIKTLRDLRKDLLKRDVDELTWLSESEDNQDSNIRLKSMRLAALIVGPE